MATKVKPSRLQVSGTPQAGCVPVYVDEDCFCWGAGGGGGGGCSEWGCITGTLCNQTDLQGALNCKLDASALSNAAYGSGWDGDSTHAATKDAIYDKIRTVDTALAGKANDISVVKLTCNQLIDGTKTFCISPVVPSKCAAVTNCDTAIATEAQVYNEITAINDLIPSAATCSNQLADKQYVNDGINSVTAYYITKNAQGDQFACYAELAAATTFYSGGVVRTPTRNDYTIVADDECYSDATTRYIYNSGWEYQYTVNETPLTTAQLNALNSGITSAKVTCYDSCMAQCCDIPTDNCQLCNGCGYVTSAAIPTDNCQLANGCGYTTCTGTITGICMNGCSCGTSGVVDLGTITPGITKIFTLSSTSDLTNAQAAYDRYINGGNPIIQVGTGAAYYHLRYSSATVLEFIMTSPNGAQTGNNVLFGIYKYQFTISSGEVTAVSQIYNTVYIGTSAPTGVTNNRITLVV